ncbi:MAG: DUF4255 domain-containing protein [Hyphomicrobium sp.]
MASWRIIEFCGQTIAQLIEQHLVRLGISNVTVGVVTAASFSALASTATPFISIFLYQIATNAEMRNWTQSLLPDGTPVRQPLPLELNYMITAWGVRQPNDLASDALAAREEARLMGAVLQSLYDNAEVGRGDLAETSTAPGWHANDSIQLVLQSLPVETHYRIWDAAELGYRLSHIYRARVTSLEPTPPRQAPVVTDAALELVP